MKKVNVLLVIMMTLQFPFLVLGKNYNIPKFSDKPTIDGSISSLEQSQSLQIDISYPEIVTPPNEGTLGTGSGDGNTPPTDDSDLSAQWNVSWDDENLYVACRVYDQSLHWLQPFPGPYNEQDCVQLNFNFLDKSSDDFEWFDGVFDIVPETSDACGPDFYTRDSNYLDAERLLINGQVLADGYIVEALIPWSSFDQYYNAHPGDVHGGCFTLVDYDPGLETILTDFSDNGQWSLDDVNSWNTFTLVDGNCGISQMSDADLNYDCSVDFKDFAIMAESWCECTHPTDENCSWTIDVIKDGQMQEAHELYNTDGTNPTIIDEIHWNSMPLGWRLAQWFTDFNFINRTHTVLPSGAHSYTDESKTLVVGPVNTEDADFILGLDARPEYNGEYRQSGEPWPQWTIDRSFVFENLPWLSDTLALNFHTKVKLLDAGKVEEEGYDPNLHCGHFQIFFTVQDLNQSSSGYGDYLWFGILIYDDRYDDVIPEFIHADEGHPVATNKLIYCPASDTWTDESIHSGDWVTLQGDLRPYMVDALNYAWTHGFFSQSSQNLSDYSIGLVVIGWEMPGISWGVMQVDELKLEAVVGVGN